MPIPNIQIQYSNAIVCSVSTLYNTIQNAGIQHLDNASLALHLSFPMLNSSK